ncbi:GtrA family protein [Marininema halotolerans]|nr:GtrA family protein [Marininema halotolerans]
MLKRKLTSLQGMRFAIVGGMNTLVDFLLFFLLTSVHWHYLLAQVVAYSGGVCNSYLMNRRWTFSSERIHVGEIGKFLTVNGISLSVAALLLYGFTHLGWGWLWAKGLATVIALVVNFFGNKWWVFPRKTPFNEPSNPITR